MKSVTIAEAKQYFDDIRPKCFLYNSKNQQEEVAFSPVLLLAKYDSMIVSVFTNRICFTSGNNKLCFSGIKEIQIDDTSGIGVFLYITCKMKGKLLTYCIIAD